MLRKWTSKDPKTEFAQLIPKALRMIGSVILGQARELCPIQSGRLKGSLTFALAGEQSTPKKPAGPGDIIGKPSSPNEVWIGTNVEYAEAVEYGTRPYEINAPVKIKGVGWRYIKRHPGISGQSYLRHALDIERKRSIKLLRDAIEADYGK